MGPITEVETAAMLALNESVSYLEKQEDYFSKEMTPSRGFSQQPASVEMALPARLASPQRYRAPQTVTQFSPIRTQCCGTTPAAATTVQMPPWPAVHSHMETVAMESIANAVHSANTAPATLPMAEVQERVQVPRHFGRSPETVLRDMGVGRTQQQMIQQQPSTAHSMVETIIREPVPAQVTVVEKVVEQHGMSSQEMQVWLQGERSRISGAMQEIMTQQSKIVTEVINEEVQKIIHMVNAVSNSCEERLVRLEADRSARATAFQGLKRDVDGLQAQIADMEQFRAIGSSAKDQAGKEREEVMAVLESVTKDIRNQHRSVLSGLTVQKELQQKLEGALGEVRADIETLAAEVGNQRTSIMGLSSQKDLLVLQKDQQTIDKAIVELRKQTQQSLELVRSELTSEVGAMRQSHIGGLSERISAIESRRLDQDVQDLTRLIHTERSGRGDLAQTLEAYRSTHLQTVVELRSEIDTLPDKLSRLEMAIVEERGARERTLSLEQGFNEIKNHCGRRFGDIEAKLEAGTYMTQDVQELKKLVGIEQSERSDLAESFETHRKSQQQMASELRAEIEHTLQELRRATSSSAQDTSARERCGQLEKSSQEICTVMSKRLSELTMRIDVFETRGMVSKDVEELTRVVRNENAARVDMSQTLDAYRMAHLQTSTELRADLDVALEKLSRFESMSSQTRLRGEDHTNALLGNRTPPLLTPHYPQAADQHNQMISRLGLGSSLLGASRTSPMGRPGGFLSGSATAMDGQLQESVAGLTAGLTPLTFSEDIRATVENVRFNSTSPAALSSSGLNAGGGNSAFESLVTREEISIEERMNVSRSAASTGAHSSVAASLSTGLFAAPDDSAGGGGLFGRGARSGAAADVAEVLADERRLISRSFRGAGGSHS